MRTDARPGSAAFAAFVPQPSEPRNFCSLVSSVQLAAVIAESWRTGMVLLGKSWPLAGPFPVIFLPKPIKSFGCAHIEG
jgi:hypothetical protein